MSSPTPPKKKELSNEVRMLLAFVLMGLILLGTPYAYRMLGIAAAPTPAKTDTSKKTPAQQAATSTASGAPMRMSGTEPKPADLKTPSASTDTVAPEAADREQEQVLDTSLY